MDRKIAGLSFRGGHKSNFCFCLLEFYQENNRWVVSEFYDSGSAKNKDDDIVVAKWIENKGIDILTVDFPRTFPPCHGCKEVCSGIASCSVENVKIVTSQIKTLLENSDSSERLTKSFKRKLKKGFVPYWNRGIDFYIWNNYYDQLLDFFNSSFNSFGHSSYIVFSRFNFIERMISSRVKIAEADNKILLIELLRQKILNNREVLGLSSFDGVDSARLNIIEKLEKNFNIFIYDHDLNSIAKNQRYFDAFLMSISGLLLSEKRTSELPAWCGTDLFIIPEFIWKSPIMEINR